MKKTILLLAVIIAVGFGSVQAQGDIKVGGGLGFSTGISSIGISLDGVYSVTEKIDGAANFTYFLENDYVTWMTIDVNGHYHLLDYEGAKIYGLGGLGLLIGTIDIPELDIWGLEPSSYTRIGLNVGGGGNYPLTDKLNLMGELKVVLSRGSHLNARVGILYSL